MSNFTIDNFELNSQLDKNYLESLYGNDLSCIIEVFESYLVHTKSEFEKAENDFINKQLKELRLTLHKMKPTFSFVGLPVVTSKTQEVIELCDTVSDFSEVEPQCIILLAEIKKSFSLIEAETTRLKNHLQ